MKSCPNGFFGEAGLALSIAGFVDTKEDSETFSSESGALASGELLLGRVVGRPSPRPLAEDEEKVGLGAAI